MVSEQLPANKTKLHLRLTREADEGLRTLQWYRGDLSRFIAEAVAGTNLMDVSLPPSPSLSDARKTTVVVSLDAGEALRSASKVRGCSTNTLVNTAILHWLRM